MDIAPPTLMLLVPPDRNYSILLQQTKMVYDQLLAVKHIKLNQGLLDRKAQFDEKCFELHSHDPGRAMEFGVRAQEVLNKQRQASKKELLALRADYQAKLNNMHEQLEMQWKNDVAKASSTTPAIPCKVYKSTAL